MIAATGLVLNSTSLAAVAYDEDLRLLQLNFQDGTRYLYSGVTPDLYHHLVGATSKGSFFNRHIRGQFPYAKIVPKN
jgi:hypothetical protein